MSKRFWSNVGLFGSIAVVGFCLGYGVPTVVSRADGCGSIITLYQYPCNLKRIKP